MKVFWTVLLLSWGLLWGVPQGRAVPTADGLYAQFNTSMGTFYCQLRYDLVPRTVANFVSLADGTKGWLDYTKAAVVKKPFYDGLIFHRVIANAIIQAGSQNGNGNDDPGYRFNDEIVAALRHDQPVIAMANSGTNSNGSQFYVTTGPQPGLDDRYTVFGQVVEGLNVVSDISNVPLNGQKPVTPVIITNVTILRIGTAANNFNATNVVPPLPAPHLKDSFVQIAGGRTSLYWQPVTNCQYRVCYSGDLVNWTGSFLGTATISGVYLDTFFTLVYRYQFFVTVETPADL